MGEVPVSFNQYDYTAGELAYTGVQPQLGDLHAFHNRAEVDIAVTITDPMTGKVLGTSKRRSNIRTDLLKAMNSDFAQDLYGHLIGAMGTEAYQAAFGRRGPE